MQIIYHSAHILVYFTKENTVKFERNVHLGYSVVNVAYEICNIVFSCREKALVNVPCYGVCGEFTYAN